MWVRCARVQLATEGPIRRIVGGIRGEVDNTVAQRVFGRVQKVANVRLVGSFVLADEAELVLNLRRA